MSDTTDIIRDKQTGRFQPGNIGGGRKPGSRNKLGEQFIADLRTVWETHGVQALIDCATTEPAQFVRVLASLMPRDVNLNVAVDVAEFALTFERALAMLGNEVPAKPRRPMKVITNVR